MTLGKDPQPLTRRQARELADRQGRSSTAHGSQPAPRSTPSAAVAVQPATDAPAVSSPTPERTTEHALTRRELRARNEAGMTGAIDIHPELASDLRAGTDASATSDTRTGAEASGPTSSKRPAVESDDEGVPIPPVPANHGRTAADRTAPDRTAAPNPAPFDASRLPGLHPPVGHWSVDRDDDDGVALDGRLEPFDQLMARGLGAGGIPTTTNALILPAIPNQGSVSGPLADSGEILITGSFDLPRSLGSTGQLPNHFDSSELDHMLDQFDDDGAPGAAVPVSASRAVSTHASTRNVMAAPKRRMPSLPAVLAVTAAVLALGVLALFVGGYLLNIF